MATSKADLQRLYEKRDRLLVEMEALKNRIGGLEMAIATLANEAGEPSNSPAKQVSVKGMLLDLLRDVAATGLTAESAVEIAARQNIKLHPGSASSTLSRMKKEGIVLYDGKVYRLPEFARPIFTVLQKSLINS